ncbi:hypothetical protein, partial [Roseovarius sp.]|uniref:hypothetical protein n=1 Tax=Roseovarius sp. TaxID=1486281 RepID=UPI0035621641
MPVQGIFDRPVIPDRGEQDVRLGLPRQREMACLGGDLSVHLAGRFDPSERFQSRDFVLFPNDLADTTVEELDRGLGEVLFVPVAPDGSLFH